MKVLFEEYGYKTEDIENVLGDFINNFFENELLNYPELIKNLTEYFAYFLEIPENIENYSSLGELYEAEKKK